MAVTTTEPSTVKAASSEASPTETTASESSSVETTTTAKAAAAVASVPRSLFLRFAAMVHSRDFAVALKS